MSLYNIAYVATGLFESIMIFSIFDTFFERKYSSYQWLYLISIFVLTGMINISNILSNNGIMNAVGMSLSFFTMSFLYNGNIPVKAVMSVLSFSLIGIIEILVLFLITVVFGLSVNDALSIQSYVLLGIIVSKMFTFMLVNILRIKFRQNSFVFKTSYWVLFILIFSTSIIAVFLIFRLSFNVQARYLYNLSVICSIGLLFTTLFALYLYEHLANQSETIRKQQQYQQYLNTQIKHVDDILIGQKQLRKFKHDFINYEIGLKAYLDNDDCDGAKEYLNNLSKGITSVENMIETGNIAFDAIINTKKAIAESKGIDFSVQIQLPAQLNIAPEDICIIFGNAMDNAIEACEKIPTKHRKIELTTIYRDGQLFCKVFNSSNSADNNMKTTKKDKENHGLGLDNIRATLGKYGSEPEISFVNDGFVLKFVVFV